MFVLILIDAHVAQSVEESKNIAKKTKTEYTEFKAYVIKV